MNKEEQIPQNKFLTWKFIIAVYVVLVAATVAWCLSFDSYELRGQLISIIPWFLEANFLLLIVAVALNINSFKKLLKELSVRQLWIVVVLVFLGVIMTTFVAPRVHRIFYDENIYLNIGQTIAAQHKAAMCADGSNNYGQYHCSQLEHNKQPYAFPYLVSIVYRIFGYSELGGFLLNNAVFGMAIFVAFLLGFLMFNSYMAGIYSALVYCLIPENIIWANTTAVEPSAALFSAMVPATALLYIREKKSEALFLFSMTLAFALQFRPESVLIIPVAGLLFWAQDKEILRDKKTYLFLVLAFALAISHIVQLYAVSGESWGSADGPRMGLTYLSYNFKTNILFYLRNVKFPFIFTSLFVGAIFLRKYFQQKIVLLVWFIMLWGIFIFFYAGSYEFGQDVRFSLLSYFPLSLLAAMCLISFEEYFTRKANIRIIRTVFIVLIFLSFTSFLPNIRTIGEEANQSRADHKYARQMFEMLPENSLVLTHNPNMFLLWGGNAAQAAIATNNKQQINHFIEKYTGGVYFHFNYWCNVDSPREQAFCQNILDNYDHEVVVKYSERGYDYVLYQLTGIRD